MNNKNEVQIEHVTSELEINNAVQSFNENVPDNYLTDIKLIPIAEEDETTFMLVLSYKPDYTDTLETIQDRLYSINDSFVNPGQSFN